MTNDEGARLGERKSFLRRLFSQAEPAPSKRPAVDADRPAQPGAAAADALPHPETPPVLEALPVEIADAPEFVPAEPVLIMPLALDPGAFLPLDALLEPAPDVPETRAPSPPPSPSPETGAAEPPAPAEIPPESAAAETVPARDSWWSPYH